MNKYQRWRTELQNWLTKQDLNKLFNEYKQKHPRAQRARFYHPDSIRYDRAGRAWATVVRIYDDMTTEGPLRVLLDDSSTSEPAW